MRGVVDGIRACTENDLPAILAIIGDAAVAYSGVIPADCWHEPYFPESRLRAELAAGVRFSGYEVDGQLMGVMGLQSVRDVDLIRHAYVRPACQGSGIGTALLAHIRQSTSRPLLVGTWAAAHWAIRFYERNGFAVATPAETAVLLDTYWSVSPRQREVSVVLR